MRSLSRFTFCIITVNWCDVAANGRDAIEPKLVLDNEHMFSLCQIPATTAVEIATLTRFEFQRVN